MYRRLSKVMGTMLLSVIACREPTAPGDTDRPDLAASGGPSVTATSPSASPRDTTLDIEVFGSGYDSRSRVDFLLGGVVAGKLHINRTTFVSTKQLTANVTVAADAAAALYDVRVTTGGGKKGIGTELFAVEVYLELSGFEGNVAPQDINDAGWVVGRADTAGIPGARAVVWGPTGQLQSLGQFEGYGFEPAGGVFGTARVDGLTRPVRWPYDAASGTWQDPEPYATRTIAQYHSYYVVAVNAAGQATGTADGTAGQTQVALWPSPSVLVELGACQGADYARGVDINASGQIAGVCRRPVGSTQEFDGFVWVPESPNASTGTFLLLPRDRGRIRNFPTALNDRGEVVGYSEDSRGRAETALIWRPSGTGYLPPVDLNAGMAVNAAANDINNASVVVGSRLTTSRGKQAAFIWDAQGGSRNLPTPGKVDAGAIAVTETLPWRIAGWTLRGDVLLGTRMGARWLVP